MAHAQPQGWTLAGSWSSPAISATADAPLRGAFLVRRSPWYATWSKNIKAKREALPKVPDLICHYYHFLKMLGKTVRRAARQTGQCKPSVEGLPGPHVAANWFAEQ